MSLHSCILTSYCYMQCLALALHYPGIHPWPKCTHLYHLPQLFHHSLGAKSNTFLKMHIAQHNAQHNVTWLTWLTWNPGTPSLRNMCFFPNHHLRNVMKASLHLCICQIESNQIKSILFFDSLLIQMHIKCISNLSNLVVNRLKKKRLLTDFSGFRVTSFL